MTDTNPTDVAVVSDDTAFDAPSAELTPAEAASADAPREHVVEAPEKAETGDEVTASDATSENRDESAAESLAAGETTDVDVTSANDEAAAEESADVEAAAAEASDTDAPEPAKARRVKPLKTDAVLTSDVAREAARAAVSEVAYRDTVGEHVGFEMNAERLGTHYFASLAKGYPDWRWAVSVARAPRAKVPTVCETNLVPTASSVLAPEWVPWADRLAPGDLSAGDVLPYKEDDPRLEAGFEATGDEDVDQMAFYELGLGRSRVLSAEGRDEAAQRWYDGDQGPSSDVARKAPAPCSTCGYFLPMAGVLRQQFGVCANDWSPADGKVVSLDFGCGAHSEIDMEAPEAHDHQDAPVLDEINTDLEVEDHETGELVATDGVEPAPDQNASAATTEAAAHA